MSWKDGAMTYIGTLNLSAPINNIWDWEKEPKRFEWEEGDYVYIPPYTTHQHFNADSAKPARFITATSRLVKALGFNWLEQVENTPDYKP